MPLCCFGLVEDVSRVLISVNVVFTSAVDERILGDEHRTLTSHISKAVLPVALQMTCGKREHCFLDSIMMGPVRG